LGEWYRHQAKQIFAERLIVCYEQARHLGIPYPQVVVREMKTRWGSCSGRTDRINLNTRLVQAPLACVDYVILHELCHFREHNHSSRYYQLLTSILPDWRHHKATLRDIGRRIL
jgi:predicted metal-dependent hydrolase